jgi:hypothetical protein
MAASLPRFFCSSLLAVLACGFASIAAAGDPTILKLEVEGAADPDRESMPGIQPGPGESEADLNRRLLESFGPHPFGQPESPKVITSREEAEERRVRQAREELLFRLEARALKRAGEPSSSEIRGLTPSSRFLALSRTLKNPELLRDRLESRVQRGELSPLDLLDAERGLFDATRNEFGYDPSFGNAYTPGRPLPSPSIVRELLEYQTHIRAERYARDRH